MRVKLFVCPKCQSGIFSRAPKDFRTCTCNAMGVSGGPDAPRLSAGSALAPKIKVVETNLKASAEALTLDWEDMVDEFGLVDKTDARLKSARPIKPDELSEYVQTGVQGKSSDEEGEGEGEDEEAAEPAEEVAEE